MVYAGSSHDGRGLSILVRSSRQPHALLSPHTAPLNKSGWVQNPMASRTPASIVIIRRVCNIIHLTAIEVRHLMLHSLRMSSPPPLQPAIRVVMMPRDTNSLGTIFGGLILSYIDQPGSVEAYQQSKPKLVTVAMHEVKFIAPVFVGDLV